MPSARQRWSYKMLPLWLQWVLPFTIATILIVALVLWVNHETNDVPSEAQVSSPTAIVEQNRQADAIMRQQQAPHSATVKRAATPSLELRTAIVTYLDGQIRIGAMSGPVTTSSCVAAAGSTGGRVALRCAIVTANVTYPFDGVVEPARRSVTFCQVVPPPVYGMYHVPVSKSCT